jgi:hypothetical protein
MLRLVLIAAAALVFVVSLALSVLEPWGAALWSAVLWSGLALAALLFERFVYKPLRRAPPGPEWTPTGERFIDPATRREVEVYFRAADGKRMYVSADETGSSRAD